MADNTARPSFQRFLAVVSGICKLSTIFVLSLAVDHSVMSAEQSLPGIIGVDDREPVTATGKRYLAVGHINVTGFRNKRICTGTLIAPDRVLTAAHCLVVARTGKIVPTGHVHFVAGVTGEQHEAHAKAKCIRLVRDKFHPVKEISPALLGDMAVISLDRKLAIEPIPLLQDARIDGRINLIHPSYPRDSRYRLLVHSGCRVLDKKYDLWQTSCDTNFASSGGPLLVKAGERDYVTAVMVGFAERRFTIAVPVSAWPRLFAGKDCG